MSADAWRVVRWHPDGRGTRGLQVGDLVRLAAPVDCRPAVGEIVRLDCERGRIVRLAIQLPGRAGAPPLTVMRRPADVALTTPSAAALRLVLAPPASGGCI